MVRRRRTLAVAALAAVTFAAGLLIGLSSHSTRRAPRAATIGPTHSLGGVPVGYAHTPAGAVRAAAEFLRAAGNPAWYAAGPRRRGLAAMATPAQAARMERDYEGQLAGHRPTALDLSVAAGESIVHVNLPLGYAVSAYAPTRARVTLWLVNIIASSTATPEEHYQTLVMTLRWLGGDWRLAGTSGHAGPIPRGEGLYNTAKSFMAGLRPMRWFDAPRP